MATETTVATASAQKDNFTSSASRDVIAALRCSGGRTSEGSVLSSDPPEPGGGPEKAPRRRALQVWGGLLPLPAGGVMPDSGYRCPWDPPNHPDAAGGRRGAGYGCGPANP